MPENGISSVSRITGSDQSQTTHVRPEERVNMSLGVESDLALDLERD